MPRATAEVKWIPKGWGGEKIICNTDKYCGKILFFIKGKKCSLHYHNIKDEHFYIHSGKILVTYAKIAETFKVDTLEQGDVFHIPPCTTHQMEALEDTYLYEFSTHDSPEDSIRLTKGD